MVLRRLGMGVLTVFGVTLVIFLLLSILPGDPEYREHAHPQPAQDHGQGHAFFSM
jgi:ABC-type dipeptide/oligopeptide/nickel transport system permease component